MPDATRSFGRRLALVTGGASGIGLGIAAALSGQGMGVVIADRSVERLQRAADLLRSKGNPRVHAIELDVTDRRAVARAAQEVTDAFGNVHVLCNSAGVNQLVPMDGATFDDWDWIMGVNFFGVVNCLVSFLPRIKAGGGGGHVVNVGSMASFIPSVQAGLYATSKFAIRGLTESLRLNLAPHGIGVSLVCPGLTRTNIWESPLRRAGFAAAEPGEQTLTKFREIHACGMDPMEVGEKTLRGMLRNDMYIFTHPEFAEELAQIHEEVSGALPREAADPRRLAAEARRREGKERARELSDKIGAAGSLTASLPAPLNP
jgi:NAD(P)-dependent dehydrogenase (short-subunit alcohol dehydrogenase family)